MAVTVQTQFESVVTQMYEEAFVGSSAAMWRSFSPRATMR
jgi:hypothetical protein